VKRYRHVLDEVYGIDAPRCALLAALLLRGPQTVGELRARTERMVDLPSVADVQEELAALAEHSEGLARLLPRRPGQKEDRWQQVLAAPWSPDGASAGGDGGARPDVESTDGYGSRDDTDAGVRFSGDRPDAAATTTPTQSSDLQAEIEVLRSELSALTDVVSALRDDLDALRRGLGG
jgi:uncharacterized protein YceH (UPF0502 family)